MLDGIDANRIIVGAYTDRAGRRLPDAGRPPLRRPHQPRELRPRLGPLHAAGGRPRPATERELRTLRAMLEASLGLEDGYLLSEVVDDVKAARRDEAARDARRPDQGLASRSSGADERAERELERV